MSSATSFRSSSLLARSALALGLALSLTGAVHAQENIEHIFGGIVAEKGQQYGALETVNGGITIRAQATVGSAETVNGGIKIGEQAVVGIAETVNGGITVSNGARVQHSLETVNGGISLGAGAQVEGRTETVNGAISSEAKARFGGDIETVNGSINLIGSEVGGDVSLTNGDITIGEGSVVAGGLRVRKPAMGWFNFNRSRDPRVVLGPNAVVKGPLVFERAVELYVHVSAKHGAITGAKAKSYSAALPARD